MSKKNKKPKRSPIDSFFVGLEMEMEKLVMYRSFSEMTPDEKADARDWQNFMEEGRRTDLTAEELEERDKRIRETNLLRRQAILEDNNNWKNLPILLRALYYAQNKHHDQTRKDEALSPYIDHLKKVAFTIMQVSNVNDMEIIAAALLHDTLEDTATNSEELEDLFGPRVCKLVEEVTDDKNLPKQERKERQIQSAANLSPDAVLIRIADKISNVRDVIHNPPKDWSKERRVDYLNWADAVVKNCQHVNQALEEEFDRILAKGRSILKAPKEKVES